jgi:hypothetical protein
LEPPSETSLLCERQPQLFRRYHCARNALRNFRDWGVLFYSTLQGDPK